VFEARRNERKHRTLRPRIQPFLRRGEDIVHSSRQVAKSAQRAAGGIMSLHIRPWAFSREQLYHNKIKGENLQILSENM
jgi:hypothetical protein